MREFIVVLLLGFFIGLSVGYYLAYKEVNSITTPHYQAEVNRLQIWNDTLIKMHLDERKRK